MRSIKTLRFTVLIGALLLTLPVFCRAELSTYFGTATITSPANLGVIDLAFTFDVVGSSIQPASSYIMTNKTLLFPAVAPKLLMSNGLPVLTNGIPVSCSVGSDCNDVGPRVSGTLTTSSFNLTTANLTQLPSCTDCFTSTVSGRTVQRKVELASTAVNNNGATLTGNYTETITGLTPQPVVVTGTFILVKPTVQTIIVDLKDQSSDGCIDLNEIRAAGANSEVLEFNDMSQALHLYSTNPSKICNEQVIKDALNEFYATQKK